MNKFFALFSLAGLLLSAPVLAELKIGLIDARPILAAAAESKAGKMHTEAMEKYAKDKRAVFAKEDEKIRALSQAFQKEVLTLSDAQKQQKEKDIQGKAAILRKMVEEAEQEGRKKDAAFKNRLEAEIRKAVEAVSREEKVNLVLSRAEVLYSDSGIDLTEKVVKKLQAALQKF